MKIVLAFDMDDTLVNTRKEIYKLAILHCVTNGLNDLFPKFVNALWSGVAVSELSTEMKEIIDKEVIAKRVYLDSAERSYFCSDELVSLLKDVRNADNEVKIVICSHRGNNKEAFMSTYRWLENKGLLDYFDMIHSIDNQVHKDKIKFLKATYPDHRILLVDDNPYSDDKESVIIYDKINKNKKYEGFEICNNPNDIFMRLFPSNA